MKQIPFNVDAYTARLIGRENVSTVDGGLLELIKNSYDASATDCIIYYEESTGSLYIMDNGIGMNEKIIINNWMTIGNSSKRINIEDNGRVQTGSKGIGRFALDKLASNCDMITKSISNNFIWSVNWENFGTGKKITETYAEIYETEQNLLDFVCDIKNKALLTFIKFKFQKNGTIFKLTNLRDNWNSSLLKKLKTKLSMSIPPNSKRDFKLYFFVENSNRKSSLITQEMIENYDYKVDFKVDDGGHIKIKLYRNEFDFRGSHQEIKNKAGFLKEEFKYFDGRPMVSEFSFQEFLNLNNDFDFSKIGSFEGELFFYKRSATSSDNEKYYYKDFSGRQKLIERFGGIKLYRDNFRVKPYGDYPSSNFDWLLLNTRKAKSPAAPSSFGSWRVRAEQIVGNIYISRLNLNLVDQSNREGIIETDEFLLFKESITSFISLLEEDRQSVLRKLNKHYFDKNKSLKNEEEIKKRLEILSQKQNKANNNKSLKQATDKKNLEEYFEAEKVASVIEKKEQEIKELEDENKIMRALATTGIVSNTYMHEFKALVQAIGINLSIAERSLSKGKFDLTKLSIKDAREKREEANEWFKVTIDSLKQDRRTMKKHSLNSLIKDFVNAWQNVMAKKPLSIKVTEKSEILFKCFPYEIESIMNNLITNSITAFEKNKSEKDLTINIELNESDNNFIITYEDDGPGLSNKYKKNPYKILAPLESDKRNERNEKIGTGMGMWIIDKTITSYKGKIDLEKNNSKENGFIIEMTLPRRRR